jgi:hypothetical protein
MKNPLFLLAPAAAIARRKPVATKFAQFRIAAVEPDANPTITEAPEAMQPSNGG